MIKLKPVKCFKCRNIIYSNKKKLTGKELCNDCFKDFMYTEFSYNHKDFMERHKDILDV